MLHERGLFAVPGGDRMATGPRDLWPHPDGESLTRPADSSPRGKSRTKRNETPAGRSGDKQENTMDGMIYGLLVLCVLLVFLIFSNVSRARATRDQKQIIKSIE